MNKYTLLQLDINKMTEDEWVRIAFEPYKRLVKNGKKINLNNYKAVWTDELKNGVTFEDLFVKFNIDHPEGFKGHSMSVGDIIMVELQDAKSAAERKPLYWYCDSIGFIALSNQDFI